MSQMISSWLSMGGYGGFVWPAYIAALVLMGALLLLSLRAARRHEGALEVARTPRRRSRAAKKPMPDQELAG